jgi:hypothetical protein
MEVIKQQDLDFTSHILLLFKACIMIIIQSWSNGIEKLTYLAGRLPLESLIRVWNFLLGMVSMNHSSRNNKCVLSQRVMWRGLSVTCLS